MSTTPAATFRTTHAVRAADARSLEFIADGTVDLVVTSPPYPMIAMWDEAFARMDPGVAAALEAEKGPLAHGLMHAALDRCWAETARVLAPGGIACVNVGDATRTVGGTFRLYANASRILEAFLALGFDALPKILWRKATNAPTKFMGSGMLPPGAYVTLEHETILVLRKGGPRKFTSAEDRRRRRESAYFWEERNAWFSDLWALAGAKQLLKTGGTRARSGAFPFEIPHRLIHMHSVQGDTVLDPFLGTGTTALAAMAAGRNSVGVERDAALVKGFLAQGSGRRAAALRAELDGVVAVRLGRHEAFARARAKAGKALYPNGPHGFGVVTRQETGLRLLRVAEVRRTDGGFAVGYAEP